jgi:hypothetical protein
MNPDLTIVDITIAKEIYDTLYQHLKHHGYKTSTDPYPYEWASTHQMNSICLYASVLFIAHICTDSNHSVTICITVCDNVINITYYGKNKIVDKYELANPNVNILKIAQSIITTLLAPHLT